MIRLFEITIISLLFFVLLTNIKARIKPILLVAATATATILAGEWVNAYVTQVTVYNSDFILWLPGRRIPVGILAAGIILTLIIYAATTRLIDLGSNLCPYPFLSGILALLLLAAFLPILERTCISLGFWEWQRNSDFTIFWYIGVYKFYFIYLISAVIPGIWLRERIHRGDQAKIVSTARRRVDGL